MMELLIALHGCCCKQQPKEETVLEKKVKRKRQRKEMQEANEQPLEMHGVADDLEESRVAAVSSKQPAVLSWSEDRSGDAHLPQAATAAGGDGGATTKKRKKNKKAKQQQAEEDGEQAEAKEEPQQQQQQKQQQRRQQQQRQQQQGKQPANKGQPANDTAEAKENDASGNGNDGAFKRKKTKKRSRQKNIRKDKRKDEEKPEYLRIGASDYLGRELTEATKRRLGLLPAEESASA